MIPKGKCLQPYPFSDILIMEDLSVYEVYTKEEGSGEYLVRKIPFLKANINFNDWYGDDGKGNWWNETLPVVEEEGELIWDY